MAVVPYQSHKQCNPLMHTAWQGIMPQRLNCIVVSWFLCSCSWLHGKQEHLYNRHSHHEVGELLRMYVAPPLPYIALPVLCSSGTCRNSCRCIMLLLQMAWSGYAPVCVCVCVWHVESSVTRGAIVSRIDACSCSGWQMQHKRVEHRSG